MTESADELTERIGDALSVDPGPFREQVEADARTIERLLEDGAFDNPQAIVGLEYEFYAAHSDTGALMRVPRRLLELIGFEKELGLHNAEMTTSPQPLNAAGLRAQEAEVSARLEAALDVTTAEEMTLVSDGLWRLPPDGEHAEAYLTDSVERTVPVSGSDGGEGTETRSVQIATNMSDAARYHAMANAAGESRPRCSIDVPNVSLSADTAMPESLITSIQPHYQVPHAADLPAYFNYALRIAGPLLALGVNSSVFPASCYDDGLSAATILSEAWMGNRIRVFESVLNDPRADPEAGEGGKVRFPRDLTSTTEAVRRIASDDVIVPMPVEEGARFDDQFAHFRLKHGTYWRWVRPVFDGSTRSAANARIEFRPIAAQPTVRDAIAFQAVFAGLLESLVRLEHPVADMPWEAALENFYAAMRDGLAADMTWVTTDGAETTDAGVLYADLFAHAEDGLRSRGLSDSAVDRYVTPLRERVDHGTSPARWTHDRVAEAVDDGASIEDAIEVATERYLTSQGRTLLSDSFASWLHS